VFAADLLANRLKAIFPGDPLLIYCQLRFRGCGKNVQMTNFFKASAGLLAVVVFVNSTGWSQDMVSPATNPTESQEQRHAATIKTQIQANSAKKKSRIKVRLQGGAEIKGYVGEWNDESFTLREQDGTMHTVKFAEVRRVDKAGMSKGAKIAIVVVAGVAIAAVVLALVVRHELNKPWNL